MFQVSRMLIFILKFGVPGVQQPVSAAKSFNQYQLPVKKSEIKFSITLDDQNVPGQIHWEATDNPNEGIEEAKAISIAVWDHFHKGTMKIDLWTKDMPVDEMKRFVIETIGGLGETLLGATGDAKMAGDIDTLCSDLTRHVEEEMRRQQK